MTIVYDLLSKWVRRTVPYQGYHSPTERVHEIRHLIEDGLGIVHDLADLILHVHHESLSHAMEMETERTVLDSALFGRLGMGEGVRAIRWEVAPHELIHSVQLMKNIEFENG